MALDRLTQITSSGISSTSTITVSAVAGVVTATTLSVTGSVTTGLDVSGIVTATTVQVGSATTIHTTGIDLGSGNINSHNINSTGIITATGGFVGAVTGNVTGDLSGNVSGTAVTATTASFTNATISGDLTVQGTTTTLDTTLTEVDKLEVGANNTTVGVAITQSGTGDILRLYDSDTQVVTVADGGSVGIGTTNPSAKLHVNGGVAVRGPATPNINLAPLSGGSGNADISFDGNDLRIVSNSSSADVRINAYSRDNDFVIKQDGDIGIGTDNPSNKLHLNGESYFYHSSGNSANYEFVSNHYTHIKITGDKDASAGGPYYNYVVTNGSDGTLEFRQNTSTNLVIKQTGNVGIGTDNPLSKLHLSDADGALIINREIDAVNQINFKTLGSQRGSIGANSGACFTVYDASSAEKLRINSSGQVGINTTSVAEGAQVQIRGSSDGVLNLDTTDGRGSFIRFKENGTTKAWVGCSEGLGTGGDQDDLGLRAVDNIFFRSGTSNKVSINSSGTLEVTNSDTGNDSAVNVLKSSGDNADKAILRVGFDASNCFEIYRIRNNADIFLNTTQSSAETRIQFLSKDVATISDRGALAVGKLIPKTVFYGVSNFDGNFNNETPTRFYLYYSAGSSPTTHHFARMISQPDWSFVKWSVRQIKAQYTATNDDGATWDNYATYSNHNFYVSNYNQQGSTSGGGNWNVIGRNQNLGPGGTFQIHAAANGGYYRDAWATDYYVSLPAYIHVILEITVWSWGGNAWDSSTSVTDVYPASFGGSATQAQADSWNVGRGIWFDAAPGSFKTRSGTITGTVWDT
jgi:hypothetical protein